ncbi:hypothetical protein M378DRAFT_162033 [Amanita muscaria Koide BX008]|uniref:Uncharacterized protein n=1 Tax=Amanita muscaria (strain Koide BX008) TaxID=946122 RepID=A0A0C2X9E6_AMAMK|nr:hypothetical protein M378DRAFT_162033 [Amanita muscaria Koide BX008]
MHFCSNTILSIQTKLPHRIRTPRTVVVPTESQSIERRDEKKGVVMKDGWNSFDGKSNSPLNNISHSSRGSSLCSRKPSRTYCPHWMFLLSLRW